LYDEFLNIKTVIPFFLEEKTEIFGTKTGGVKNRRIKDEVPLVYRIKGITFIYVVNIPFYDSFLKEEELRNNLIFYDLP
jgi:hypothetical protein